MKALDGDGGLNGQVRYSLGDDVSPALVYIDDRTGVLRLSTSLDRETTQQLEFTIWAKDSAPQQPNSASAQVYDRSLLAPFARPDCLDCLGNHAPLFFFFGGGARAWTTKKQWKVKEK